MALIEGINNKINHKVMIKPDLKEEVIKGTKEVNSNINKQTDKVPIKGITKIQPINLINNHITIIKAINSINKTGSEDKGKVNKELNKIRDNQDSQNRTNKKILTKMMVSQDSQNQISKVILIKADRLVNSLIISMKTEVIHLNKIQEPHKEAEINIRKKHPNKQCKIT